MTFPDGFGWGAATSAYQIEGASTEDGRGVSIWDTFSHTPGRIRNGDTGDVAADHYHRYEADLDLMAGLGLTSYRFSIAWPRVMPDGTGAVNERGLDFYRRLVDGLDARGITPMATLFHWDLPQPLQDKGGWANRDSASWFAEYAEAVFRGLGEAVPTWLTLNEPKTVVNVGYQLGTHAPGIEDVAESYVVAHHLLLAHGLAVQAFRATGQRGRIGPALNLTPVYPAAPDGPPDAVARADGFENRIYTDPIFRGAYPDDVLAAAPSLATAIRDGDLAVISSPIDLLAVQYYTPLYVDPDGNQVEKHPLTDAFWQQIYPDGLYDLLLWIKDRYGDIPLTITENGRPCSDAVVEGRVHDPDRIEFLRDHLAAASRAIERGVALESYHVWSLLDNFEWAEGYAQRWGLVYVDYTTQERIEKSSAAWYRTVISRNSLP